MPRTVDRKSTDCDLTWAPTQAGITVGTREAYSDLDLLIYEASKKTGAQVKSRSVNLLSTVWGTLG